MDSPSEKREAIFRVRWRDRLQTYFSIIFILFGAGYSLTLALSIRDKLRPGTGPRNFEIWFEWTMGVTAAFGILLAAHVLLRQRNSDVVVSAQSLSIPRAHWLPWKRWDLPFAELSRWGHGPVGFRLDYPGEGILFEAPDGKPHTLLPHHYQDGEALRELLLAAIKHPPSEVRPAFGGRLRFTQG